MTERPTWCDPPQDASRNCSNRDLLIAFLKASLPVIMPLLHQRLDGGIHEPHAGAAAALHGILQLVHLALTDQIGDRGRVDEDLQCGHAALAAGRGNELLRHDSAKAGRQHRPHVRLLVGRERVDQSIDGGRGAVRVQSAHHQNAHLGSGHGDAHGLEVAKLADQDDVRVLAQRGQQGR